MANSEAFTLLRRLYRERVPVKVLLQEDVILQGLSTWGVDVQIAIVREILADDLAARFPPSMAYYRLFLHDIIDLLERFHQELSDELLDMYLSILDKPSQDDINGIKYQIFSPFGDVGRLIVIGQGVKFNEVGLTMWPAAYLLAEYFIAHRALLHGRRVLELGSGCGLTGLVLAAIGGYSKLSLTDGVSSVVENLTSNVVLNGFSESETFEIRLFDFVEAAAEDWAEMRADVIVAADLVYLTELAVSLPYSLNKALEAVPGAVAYIGVAKRKPETLARFLERCCDLSLQCVPATTPLDDGRCFYYDRTAVLLYIITRKF